METRKECSLAFQLGVSIPTVAVNSPLAPLRSDSGDPPGSGKMVSLADLHVQSKTPPIQSCLESQVRKETLLLSCRKWVGGMGRARNIWDSVKRLHPSLVVLLLQAVDPLDPWLQQLVQDKCFSAAVEAGQLHAAAAAATKVIRVC